MRLVALMCLVGTLALGQVSPDERIQSEFQSTMELAGPPAQGETLDEEAARTRAELFKKSLEAFLARWQPRSDDLSTGRLTLGKALALAGRPEEALPHFAAFVQDHPDSPDVEEGLLSLGSAHLDAGDFNAAAKVFSDFLAERKESNQRQVAGYYLGITRYQQGSVTEALHLLREVVQSGVETPLVADANIKYIEILRDCGRAEEARAWLKELQEKHPDAPYLLALQEQLEWLGKEAPELEGVDTWLQGEPVKISDLRGRVVVLNFFADRYEACQSELEALAALVPRFAGRPVTFLGLTKHYRPLEQVPAEAQVVLLQDFLRDRGVPFTVGIAQDFANLRAYGVRGIPHTVVIGKDGRIVHLKVGGSKRSQRSLQDLVAAIERAAEG